MSEDDALLARSWAAEWDSLPEGPPLVLAPRPETAQITLRISNSTLDRLKERAHALRIPYHRLARELIEAELLALDG